VRRAHPFGALSKQTFALEREGGVKGAFFREV
jgi:hypothetical protein